jgi:hypothetical protein
MVLARRSIRFDNHDGISKRSRPLWDSFPRWLMKRDSANKVEIKRNQEFKAQCAFKYPEGFPIGKTGHNEPPTILIGQDIHTPRSQG